MVPLVLGLVVVISDTRTPGHWESTALACMSACVIPAHALVSHVCMCDPFPCYRQVFACLHLSSVSVQTAASYHLEHELKREAAPWQWQIRTLAKQVDDYALKMLPELAVVMNNFKQMQTEKSVMNPPPTCNNHQFMAKLVSLFHSSTLFHLLDCFRIHFRAFQGNRFFSTVNCHRYVVFFISIP